MWNGVIEGFLRGCRETEPEGSSPRRGWRRGFLWGHEGRLNIDDDPLLTQLCYLSVIHFADREAIRDLGRSHHLLGGVTLRFIHEIGYYPLLCHRSSFSYRRKTLSTNALPRNVVPIVQEDLLIVFGGPLVLDNDGCIAVTEYAITRPILTTNRNNL